MKRQLVLAFLMTFYCVTTATAIPVSNVPLPGGYLNVEYFTGTGTQTAYFVVDFGHNGGGSYAFGYRWNGTQAADNALLQIDAAGAIEMATTNIGSASAPILGVDSFGYGTDFEFGDFSPNYWGYWLGSYNSNSVTWTFSDFGISGREFGDDNNNGTPDEILQTIVDGGFYGFRVNDVFPPSSLPLLPVAVPEPTAGIMAVSGLVLALIARRRSRRDKAVGVN